MTEFFKNMLLRNKKNIISALILLIIILAVPLTLQLVQRQQILRSRAQVGTPGVVTFSGPNVATRANRTVLKLDEDGNAIVDLIITSPLGPPAATSSATPSGGLR